MFSRQAYVGPSADSWGTVMLSRQRDPLVDLVQPVQGNSWLGGFFSSPGGIDNADNNARINNTVKWASPNWSGLQFVAKHSFGGVAGSAGLGQRTAVRLRTAPARCRWLPGICISTTGTCRCRRVARCHRICCSTAR